MVGRRAREELWTCCKAANKGHHECVGVHPTANVKKHVTTERVCRWLDADRRRRVTSRSVAGQDSGRPCDCTAVQLGGWDTELLIRGTF